MNIALIGHGKMGKLIETLAIEQGYNITLVIDANNKQDLNKNNLDKCDVAIEFSTPDSALDNILTCIDAKIPIVVGTTGKWYEHISHIKSKVQQNNTALLYATNFSLGVNIFFAINNFIAKIMAAYKEYTPKIEEIHHTEKKDSPSGTAITLAEGIMENIKYKTKWQNLVDNSPNNNKGNRDTLDIVSIRKDPAPGTHIVKYTSIVDNLEIKHEAFNRNGFALGAILAAKWLKDKKGIYKMDDILKFN